METPPRPLSNILREEQEPQRKREREPLLWTWGASLVGLAIALLIDLSAIYSGWALVKLLSLNATILGFSVLSASHLLGCRPGTTSTILDPICPCEMLGACFIPR